MAKTPSYIFLRRGIYYFQMRVPASIGGDNFPASRLIRKSTRTGNRRQALQIARQWWVEIMSINHFDKNQPRLVGIEQCEPNIDGLNGKERIQFQPNQGGSSIPLTDVLHRWVKFNTVTRKRGNRWSASSLKKFVPSVQMMIEMVGNPPN